MRRADDSQCNRIALNHDSVVASWSTWNHIAASAIVEIPTDRDIRGDGEIKDADPATSGVQPTFDELGNRVTTGEAIPTQDLLYGRDGGSGLSAAGYLSSLASDGVSGANDSLVGGDLGDILRGNGGDDFLYAGADSALEDAIAAGAIGDGVDGPIRIIGTINDALSGNDGDDTLIGSTGADLLTGGAGDDTIVAMQGNDFLRGDGDYDPTTTDWLFNWSVTQVFEGANYHFVYGGEWSSQRRRRRQRHSARRRWR